ncbi:hypothetical protein CDAR_273571 [Caerostris darwini]|uniref:Uncharacterized protein n=1 Tax=Caerostris darwini TaxID=1538125 RepID=A0AAV4T0L9_9ARAC|nr:hypothetical protein CDAR_273571 [Caerostris darwini]
MDNSLRRSKKNVPVHWKTISRHPSQRDSGERKQKKFYCSMYVVSNSIVIQEPSHFSPIHFAVNGGGSWKQWHFAAVSGDDIEQEEHISESLAICTVSHGCTTEQSCT